MPTVLFYRCYHKYSVMQISSGCRIQVFQDPGRWRVKDRSRFLNCLRFYFSRRTKNLILRIKPPHRRLHTVSLLVILSFSSFLHYKHSSQANCVRIHFIVPVRFDVCIRFIAPVRFVDTAQTQTRDRTFFSLSYIIQSDISS